MLKRYTTDFSVENVKQIDADFIMLELRHPSQLPAIDAGQFAEIRIPDTAKTFLRRPISIEDVDYESNTISLLIKKVGNGTRLLGDLKQGDSLNLVYPLGNGFAIDKAGDRPLLVGGGVGIAPMMYLARKLVQRGAQPEFLFGARNAAGLLLLSEFEKLGKVNITTEDGSVGTKGFVTNHKALGDNLSAYTSLLVCGPTPMMQAVAKIATAANIHCQVSLENKMACGIGVCLCCVTDTVDGHKCVCSDGPVFDIKQLKW